MDVKMTSARQKNNARHKECMHGVGARNLPPGHSGRRTSLEGPFVMSASKISSTDGSLKVSSAGTTKKNTEGQMNEKEEVATGKGEKTEN